MVVVEVSAKTARLTLVFWIEFDDDSSLAIPKNGKADVDPDHEVDSNRVVIPHNFGLVGKISQLAVGNYPAIVISVSAMIEKDLVLIHHRDLYRSRTNQSVPLAIVVLHVDLERSGSSETVILRQDVVAGTGEIVRIVVESFVVSLAVRLTSSRAAVLSAAPSRVLTHTFVAVLVKGVSRKVSFSAIITRTFARLYAGEGFFVQNRSIRTAASFFARCWYAVVIQVLTSFPAGDACTTVAASLVLFSRATLCGS